MKSTTILKPALLAMCLLAGTVRSDTRPPSAPTTEETRQEELDLRISQSKHIILVCIYKEKWIPPEDTNLPKGRLVESARIVRTIKGGLQPGKKFEYHLSIENTSRGLLEYEKTTEGELAYIFTSEDEDPREEDGRYVLKAPNPHTIGMDHPDAPLMLKKHPL